MKEFLRLIIISIPFIKKKHNKYGINITQRLNKKFKPNTQPPCQVSSVFRLWERKKKKIPLCAAGKEKRHKAGSGGS